MTIQADALLQGMSLKTGLLHHPRLHLYLPHPGTPLCLWLPLLRMQHVLQPERVHSAHPCAVSAAGRAELHCNVAQLYNPVRHRSHCTHSHVKVSSPLEHQ